MSFQPPKLVNLPGQGKRPGVPGKFPGPQTGARPGLPKPKNPTLVGGKPMVPISNLMQFTPKFEQETTSETPESAKNGLTTFPDGNVNGIQDDNVENQKGGVTTKLDADAKEDLRDGEERKVDRNGKINTGLEVDPEESGVHQKKDGLILLGDPEISSAKVFHSKPLVSHSEEYGSLMARKQKSAQNEAHLLPEKSKHQQNEKLAMTKNDRQHGDKRNSKENELNSPSLTFGPSQSVINNERDEDLGFEKQNSSPLLHEKRNLEEYQEGRSTQDEPRDSGTHDDPSSGISHGNKAKDPFEVAEVYGEVSRSPIKQFEVKREENTTLIAQLKALSLELERERKEKSVLRAENEKFINENVELKGQLEKVSSKMEGLQRRDNSSRDLARKDEEIKRLRNEIKSTMEGSRLITEHSNKVISESTKYKEETEILIATLEKEKEELHKKFIEYKKETHHNYVSKLVGLQEKVDYLQNKLGEYENEVQRSQSDLKQKISTAHKLAQINNEMQSTLSYWPTFSQVYFTQASETKEETPQDEELVNFEKSPAVYTIIEKEETLLVEHLEPQIRLEEVKNENIVEEDITIEPEIQENWGQEEINVEEAINVETNVYNEEEVPQNYIQEEIEIEQYHPIDQKEYIEENEAQANLEIFQNNLATEPLENGWGVEEPILLETDIPVEEKTEETLQQSPPENEVLISTVEDHREPEPHFVENTYNEEPPKLPERHQEIEEEKPVMNTLTAPPSNRLPQKKKKANPPPRQFVGFKPTAPTFENVHESEPINQHSEEVNGTSNFSEPTKEEIDERPPTNQFVAFRPPMGKPNIPNKKPNFPHFNPITQNKPQPHFYNPEANNGYHVDLVSENVQPLQEEGIAVELDNTEAHPKTNGSQDNLDLDKTSNTSFEHKETSSSRKMSYNIESQNELEGSETQETKAKVNGHGIGHKPVKISKAIKKKEPATGSIFS